MELRRKIQEKLIDNDLALAQQEIGYLKDLCDAKDNVIAYQKELLNIQGESIKRFRLLEEELKELKESMNKKGKKNEK